jgi:HPr kinase/phosphorylase
VTDREDITLIHAACIALDGTGVLIIGPPGSGKSDLALRLIDCPGKAIGNKIIEATLVSDDQVRLRRHGFDLFAEPPAAIAGRLEIRGVGIVSLSHLMSAPVRLAVQLADMTSIDRLPEDAASRYTALGVTIPMVSIDASTASAPARVRAAFLRLST